MRFYILKDHIYIYTHTYKLYVYIVIIGIISNKVILKLTELY